MIDVTPLANALIMVLAVLITVYLICLLYTSTVGGTGSPVYRRVEIADASQFIPAGAGGQQSAGRGHAAVGGYSGRHLSVTGDADQFFGHCAAGADLFSGYAAGSVGVADVYKRQGFFITIFAV